MIDRSRRIRGSAALVAGAVVAGLALGGCGTEETDETVVTFPISALGAEAEVVRRQLARFMEENPGIRVEHRVTPDAADQRYQLYVTWLNAGVSTPDILQLDVIWTPGFAAAGWILPLDRFGPEREAFFPSTVVANVWQDRLYALPWFVDVGMLYWRTDLMDGPPETFEELARIAAATRARGDVDHGFAWQGARYEGLVTVFLEHLGGFGGQILDDRGRVVVDSDEAVRALEFMRDAIHEWGISPPSVLTWQEEQTRFAFQNANVAFMRNWPYAYGLMQDPERSRVAGRFSVAPMPAESGGQHTAALGGSQLAINANTRHPEAAWAVIEYLTRPEQMLERAEVVGQYPTRPDLYEGAELGEAVAVPPELAAEIIGSARPRPVSPVYTELSQILQVRLHRVLTRQEEPGPALAAAARDMQRLLEEVGLAGDDG